MNVFEKVTESPEALASLLRALPAIETPWDDAFHRLYCSSCSAADCDDCRRPERDNPLWWLGLPAAEVEKCGARSRTGTRTLSPHSRRSSSGAPVFSPRNGRKRPLLQKSPLSARRAKCELPRVQMA